MRGAAGDLPLREVREAGSRLEARVRGLPVRYEVAGEGEPVVLVHGLSGSMRWWARNVGTLAERHRVYLADLPGFGAMRRLRRHFVLTETADWLSEWMEAAGLDRAVHETPRFLPVLLRDALRMGPVTLWRAARDLLAEDLQRIEAPTLLVLGEKDPLIPPAIGDLLRAEIPGSGLLVMKDAAHVPMFDRPEEFNAVLLAFLRGEPVGE